MARPIYESRADVERETEVRRRLADAFRCLVYRTPPLTAWDAELWRCRFKVGIAEIKCRGFRSGAFADYKIAKAKIDAGIVEGERAAVPFYLVVALIDIDLIRRIGKLDPPGFSTVRWGRTDRGDALDVELAYVIPFRTFKKLG